MPGCPKRGDLAEDQPRAPAPPPLRSRTGRRGLVWDCDDGEPRSFSRQLGRNQLVALSVRYTMPAICEFAVGEGLIGMPYARSAMSAGEFWGGDRMFFRLSFLKM